MRGPVTPKTFSNISWSEWRWVIRCTLVLLAVMFLPYAYGYLTTPPDLQFMGIHTLNSGDTYTYLAWMQQAREGNLLFINLYTSEPHERVFFHPLFLMMGWLAEALRLTNIAAFHLSRVFLVFVFCLVVYAFIAKYLPSAFWRRTCFLLISTSSGLGWLLGSVVPSAVDLWQPEAITFMSLYESPLFTASLLLMLVVFYAWLQSLENTPRCAIGAGLAMLILSVIHQYDVCTVGATLAVCSALLWWLRGISAYRLLGRVAVILGLSSPGIVYSLWAVSTNPVFRAWSQARIDASPGPLGYVVGFGVVFFLALIGIAKVISHSTVRGLLLTSWVLTTAVLVYTPISFQRRLIQGVHIPLTILATVGLSRLVAWLIRRAPLSRGSPWQFRRVIVEVVIVLSCLSNVVLLKRDILAFRSKTWPYYVNKSTMEGIDWLAKHTDSSQIVLAPPEIGYWIPGIAGNQVYVGHNPSTINLQRKLATVAWFFGSSTPDPEKLQFLRDNRISYIFTDQALQFGDWDVDDYLRLVFVNDDVWIWRVESTQWKTSVKLPSFNRAISAQVCRMPNAGSRTTEASKAPRKAPRRSAA